MAPPWKCDIYASEDWRRVELRSDVTFKVELHEGKAEICFGLWSCYAHTGVAPRALKINEPRYSATSEHERFLYIRGKGCVTVEEIDPE